MKRIESIDLGLGRQFGILLLFATVMYSASLNAQTAQPKAGDTVWVVSNGKKEKKVIGNVTPIHPSELKINEKRLLPELTCESALDAMNIKYEPVAGLELNRKFAFCKPYSRSLHNTVASGDSHFLTYLEHYFTGVLIHYEYNSPDSMVADYNNYFNDMKNMIMGRYNYLSRVTERDRRYFYIARDHLIDIAGKYDTDYRNKFSMKDMEKNVHYLSNDSGEIPFNADIAVQYPLPVKNVNGDRKFPKKYSRCEVLLLHKNNLGPLVLYCFYTDEGYKKRREYMEKLEKSIRFKE
jgi:hypothetical protein